MEWGRSILLWASVCAVNRHIEVNINTLSEFNEAWYFSDWFYIGSSVYLKDAATALCIALSSAHIESLFMKKNGECATDGAPYLL